MQLRLNRFTALLLWLALSPLVLLLWLVRLVTGRGKKRDYQSTIAGDLLAYDGERPLVIALWAEGAAVWDAATEAIITGLQAELAGRCEFAYVNCSRRADLERYQAQVVPTVVIRHRGAEVARFPNALDGAPIRAALQPLLA